MKYAKNAKENISIIVSLINVLKVAIRLVSLWQQSNTLEIHFLIPVNLSMVYYT